MRILWCIQTANKHPTKIQAISTKARVECGIWSLRPVSIAQALIPNTISHIAVGR